MATVLLLLLSLCVCGQESAQGGGGFRSAPDSVLGGVSAPLPAVLASASPSPAEVAKEVMHSSMVGVGKSNILDSYLSPYDYTGTDVRIQRETMRMTLLGRGRVMNQVLIDLNVALNENRAGNIDEYAGGLRYSQRWLYHVVGRNAVRPDSRWTLAGGLGLSGYVGGVLVDRGGNNPGQFRSELMLDLTAMAVYRLRMGRLVCPVRYQLTVPLVGGAFSPNYGQSYYEVFSEGDYDHNVVFAHVGNMPSLRYRLTVDVPLCHDRYTVRLGYVARLDQAKYNGLKYHQYAHCLMVGFNKFLYRR